MATAFPGCPVPQRAPGSLGRRLLKPSRTRYAQTMSKRPGPAEPAIRGYVSSACVVPCCSPWTDITKSTAVECSGSVLLVDVSVLDHERDFPRVVDVARWVGGQHDQVGALAGGDRATLCG